MSQLVGLLDFVPLLTPRFERPSHLAPLVSHLERAIREPVRLVFSVPPRHAKTELLLHAIPWWQLQRPDLQIAYVSYAAGIAQRKGRKALHNARRAGVPIDERAAARGDWRTGVEDGGLLSFGIDGQATGEGFHVIIVDDPVKNRATAESELERDKLWDAFNDDLFTRGEPDASVFVCHTRWHEDDLAGRLIRAGWPHVNLAALDDNGRALWPARYTAESLVARREQIGAYGFESLFQGRPRPRGGAVFTNAVTYKELPPRLRVSIGVDLAYTAKSRADYSVAVVLGTDDEDRHYVVEVAREQVAASDFVTTLKRLAAAYPGAPISAFIGGTERGTIDLFAELGVRIDAKPATTDKFVRSQPVAAAWNARKVLVPGAETAMWVTPFLNEVLGFTGVRDRHDDMVDALAAAHDLVRVSQLIDFPSFIRVPGLSRFDEGDYDFRRPPPDDDDDFMPSRAI